MVQLMMVEVKDEGVVRGESIDITGGMKKARLR